MTGTGHAGSDYGEDEYDDELTTSVASTSLPSTLHRRSSAPEMDEKLIESTSASISVVSSDVSSMKTNYPAPALVKPPLPEKPRGGGLGSKSLDRASAAAKKHHHRHPPYSSFSADRISDASAPSSDSEAAPATTTPARHFDRAKAVKAVVHRSPASPASSQAMASLGPYDTIKPSRMRSKGGSSNDSSNSYVPKSNSSSSSAKTVIKVAAAETAAVQPSQQQLLPKVTLKRADSFEGHEEAVRTLVEAVNESRKFEATSAAAKQLRKDDECE